MSDKKYKINIADSENTGSNNAGDNKMTDLSQYSVLYGYIKRCPENNNKPALAITVLDNEINALDFGEAAYSVISSTYQYLEHYGSEKACAGFAKAVRTCLEKDARFFPDKKKGD